MRAEKGSPSGEKYVKFDVISICMLIFREAVLSPVLLEIPITSSASLAFSRSHQYVEIRSYADDVLH